MADSSLTVTGGSGGNQTPANQSNLQAATTGNLNPSQSKNFQPGITGSSLNSTQGISLNPTALSTVALSGNTSGSTATKAAVVQTHHFNPVLILGVLLLFSVAAVMFIVTNQSGKKYNQY